MDLLLGRDPLPRVNACLDTDCELPPTGGGRAGCGCWPGAPVPCGAQLLIHVPLHTALGTSDEPAELVGHGALEPDLLRDLLLAAPELRAVWTDERGVPVAIAERTLRPTRDDGLSVRQALLDLATQPPPGKRHPRHPHDHPPAAPLTAPVVAPVSPSGAAPDGAAPTDAMLQRTGGSAAPPGSTHPLDQPGAYRLPRALRRLVEVRSPRCEWPGCGARAARCDAEHDVAWPDGPTCACNLGPCCRRHHRIKQHGWNKTRHAGSDLTWTSPEGRTWRSRGQHQPPSTPVRPRSSVPTPHPFDELSPTQLEDELSSLGLLPDDPHGPGLRTLEPRQHADRDVLGEHLTAGDTRWTLDLDDPYRWHEAA